MPVYSCISFDRAVGFEAPRLITESPRNYPREALPNTFLLAHINKPAGQFGKGGSTKARKAILLDRDFSFGYFNLAISDVYLDRLEKPRTHCSARRDVRCKWMSSLGWTTYRLPER